MSLKSNQLIITLFKQNSEKEKYILTDLDYIYCEIPLEYKGFYLIPSYEFKSLIERGQLTFSIPIPFTNSHSSRHYFDKYAFFYIDLDSKNLLEYLNPNPCKNQIESSKRHILNECIIII